MTDWILLTILATEGLQYLVSHIAFDTDKTRRKSIVYLWAVVEAALQRAKKLAYTFSWGIIPVMEDSICGLLALESTAFSFFHTTTKPCRISYGLFKPWGVNSRILWLIALPESRIGSSHFRLLPCISVSWFNTTSISLPMIAMDPKKPQQCRKTKKACIYITLCLTLVPTMFEALTSIVELSSRPSQ